MSDRFPDIEIYIKRPALADLLAWLQRRFGAVEILRHGDSLTCMLGEEPVECVIVENAVKGGFTSLWFKSQSTPWTTDRDCAVEALAEFGLEIRCSTGSWQEEADSEGWLRITGDGESNVNWL